MGTCLEPKWEPGWDFSRHRALPLCGTPKGLTKTYENLIAVPTLREYGLEFVSTSSPREEHIVFTTDSG